LSSKRKKKLKIKAGVHTMDASRRGVCATIPGARIRRLYSSWVVIGTYCIRLVILVTIIFVGSSQGRELRQAATAASRHERRLEAYTDSSNGAPMHGPAVQSFQVSDGSWVDCIPIEQQIAAHHPALQDHIIRMQESSSTHLNLQQQNADKQSLLHPQRFAREHGGCPEGSIPVQRMSTDSKQLSLRKQQQYYRRHPRHSKHMGNGSAAAANDLGHLYAVVGAPETVGAYAGAGAIFSVNGPVIGDPSNEFSLSQLWIAAGNGNNTNTVEVGWQTYPALHQGDNPLAPHLFVYWTSDDYQGIGCYNLECPGFVQTSNTWVLGGSLAYTTLAEETQNEFNYEDEISISVTFDSTIPGWSLFINETNVGYWPSSLYTTLQTSADTVEWGGEIAPSTIPTNTSMGSGAFPSAGFPLPAYQRNVIFYDSALTPMNADLSLLGVTNANCYNVSIQQSGDFANWGSYFFFGGPGGLDSACV
jgi:hypothetical protein